MLTGVFSQAADLIKAANGGAVSLGVTSISQAAAVLTPLQASPTTEAAALAEVVTSYVTVVETMTVYV